MAYSFMHSRAVSLSLESYVRWRALLAEVELIVVFAVAFEDRTLPRASDTRISVLGGV